MRELHNQYFFEVDPAANKHEIQQAVEHFFGVKVTQVRTMNYRGKIKRMGRFSGKRADWKKAVVTLAEGDTIDLFDDRSSRTRSRRTVAAEGSWKRWQSGNSSP